VKPLDKPLLILVTAAMTSWIAATSMLNRYVRTTMRPWLLAAGVVLALAGLISLVRARRQLDMERSGDQDHSNGHHRSRAGWMLLLLVVVVVLADPSALGASSVARGQSALRQPRTPHLDLPRFLASHTGGGQIPQLTMAQFLAAVSDDEDAELLAETDIELLGFVVENTSTGFLLARLQIGCCAADAVPVIVDVRSAEPGSFEPDSWLAVVGRYDRETTEGLLETHSNDTAVFPVFVAASMHPAQPPDPVYEYPY
jgi:uncharacterized repeat protein (TIGR03943 family)